MTISQEQPQIRQQLTLFIQDSLEVIEEIRKEFNPVQYELISAHVTLCREDEITSIDRVFENIKSIMFEQPLIINFDTVDRFENGKGAWLPASRDNKQFQELRTKILKGINDLPRQHLPHVTLMHPRNSTCTDDTFFKIQQYKLPTNLLFDKVSLIEQKNSGRWKVLNEFSILP